MSLLGMDMGVSGVDVSIYSEDGDLLAQTRREFTPKHPSPGAMELDPYEVWASSRQAVREACERVNGDPVDAVGVSSDGLTCVPVDQKGRPVARGVIGGDRRAAEAFKGWADHADVGEVFRVTGQPPAQDFALSKAIWLRQNEPGTYSKTWKLLSLGEFIQVQMGLDPCRDYSLASRTMAFDIHRKCYSPKVCGFAGVDVGAFGRAVPTGHLAGTLGGNAAEKLCLSEGCLVCAVSYDVAAAMLGSGAVESGSALDASGSYRSIAVSIDQPLVNDTVRQKNVACCLHVVPGAFFSLIPIRGQDVLGDWACQVAVAHGKQYGHESEGEGIENLVRGMAKAPTDMLVLPPSAGDQEFGDGAIFGLTLSTSRGQLLKAISEGAAYETKARLQELEMAGIEGREFRVAGSDSDLAPWLQLKADVLGRSVSRVSVPHPASRGMALVAGEAAGVYESAPAAALQFSRERKTFEPNTEKRQFYGEMFERYQELGPSLQEWAEEAQFAGEFDES